jgi:transcriptional regulator with XRE-family HTH domain
MSPTREDVLMKSSSDDLRQQLVDSRDDKGYRHAYADESLNISIATQIKVLREQRNLRQTDLAELAGMKQSMISRYENVNYSSWSINTLRKLAEAFDVTLDVRFRSFKDLVTLTQGFSRETLEVSSFSNDPYFSEAYQPQQVSTFIAKPESAENLVNNILFVPHTGQHILICGMPSAPTPNIIYGTEIAGFEGVTNAQKEEIDIPSIRNFNPSAYRELYPGTLRRDWGQRVSAD